MPRFSLAPGLVTFYSIYLDTETLLSLEDHLCSASVRIGTSLPSVLCSFCLHIFSKLMDTDQQSRTSVSHGGSRAVSAIVQAKHDYWTRGRSFKNVWWFKRSVWCDFIQAQSQIATAEELNVSSSVMREKWRFETDWLSYGCNAEQPRQHEEGMAVCGHCGSCYLKWMHVCLYANGAQTLLPILHGGHLLKLKTRSIMTLSVINIWPVKVSYLGRITRKPTQKLDYCYYPSNSLFLSASFLWDSIYSSFWKTACPHPWAMRRHLVWETVNPLMSLLRRDSADETELHRAWKQMARRQWCRGSTKAPD